MNVQILQTAINKSLKHSVTVKLTNGGSLPIKHPDFASISPGGHNLLVWLPTGGFDVVDLGEIATVSVRPGKVAT